MSEARYNGQSTTALVTPPCSRHADGGRATLPTFKPIPESILLHPNEFWERVDVDMYDTDACFIWKGSKFADGYGVFRGIVVHRIAYTFIKGAIPDGYTIDHTCHRRECCNPAHLEAVTLSENIARRSTAATKYPARKRNAARYGRRRGRGVCVQCNTPSTKYRCDRCRSTHNQRNKGRKR